MWLEILRHPHFHSIEIVKAQTLLLVKHTIGNGQNAHEVDRQHLL